MSESDVINDYYSERSATYDRTVRPAVRWPDMEDLVGELEKKFTGRNVLEVACGTGYWTQIIARSASLVKAVDINVAMIQRAAIKLKRAANVTLEIADAYSLASVNELYDVGFGGFWWSHIPKSRIPCFLSALWRKLKGGASVIMVDNNYVKGCSGPITGMDREGNTYQTRILDGRKYEIVKNFPTPEELQAAFRNFACHITVVSLKHYWMLLCEQ